MLDAQPPAALRDRAHIAFGWLAVKRAMGKEALEHFAQVQSLPVPPLAMAAALSLTGDDARALTLWERAVVNGADPVVWHELAATLLRLGREGDVRRLPQVAAGPGLGGGAARALPARRVSAGSDGR